jgi:hypothetical protein
MAGGNNLFCSTALLFYFYRHRYLHTPYIYAAAIDLYLLDKAVNLHYKDSATLEAVI